MRSAPRHVMMTADAVGGVWTYALDLAGGLVARDVAVTLAVLGPMPTADQAREAEARGARVVDTGLTLDWLEDDPHRLARTGQKLAALAAEIEADLVHLNSPVFAVEAGFAQPVVGVAHSCLASWWEAVRGGERPDSFRWRTERLARGYQACDRVVAPSRAFAARTEALYDVTVDALRNGRSQQARRAGAKEPVVLTSGRLWDEGKGLRTLDRAAGRVRGRIEAAGSLIGPDGATVGCEAVLALGPLSRTELDDRLNRAAVFCSMALYEPFGLGVLEASQAGCALVLSDIPSFRELWDGVAIFVEPRDDAALAEVLNGLLADPDWTSRLGALAARSAQVYSADAMVEATLAVYAEALAEAAVLPVEEAA